MAHLIGTQQALVAVIKDFADTLQATPPEEWTLGLVEARMEVLQDYWVDFQANHLGLISAAEQPVGDYDSKRVYSDIERAYIRARSQLLDARRRLEPPVPANVSGGPHDQSDETRQNFSMGLSRLPQIDVPTFSERREDWESFRDLFRALIHEDPRLSDVARFFYLKTHVQGDAKAALETLKLTNTNYASAWRLLESRYEHRRLLVQDHLTAMRNLRPLRDETSTGLQALSDTLCRHRDQLQALNRPVEKWDDWFISIAASCMDTQTRRAWENDLEKLSSSPFDVTRPEAESTRTEDDVATFSMLTEFLQRRCHMISSVEGAMPSRPAQSRSGGGPTTSRGYRSFATRSLPSSCSHCQGAHYIGHCERFLALRPDARRDVVLQARLCYNCLRAGHAARSCLSKSVCQLCQALHHSLRHNSDRKRAAADTASIGLSKQPRLSTPAADATDSEQPGTSSS